MFHRHTDGACVSRWLSFVRSNPTSCSEGLRIHGIPVIQRDSGGRMKIFCRDMSGDVVAADSDKTHPPDSRVRLSKADIKCLTNCLFENRRNICQNANQICRLNGRLAARVRYLRDFTSCHDCGTLCALLTYISVPRTISVTQLE